MLIRLSLVTILQLSAVFYGVHAQVRPAKSMENAGQKSQKYSLGLKVGPTITMGHFPKNLPDTVLQTHTNRPKTGFTIAGVLTLPLPNNYSCVMEAGYMKGGRKVDYNNNQWQNDFTYKFITSSLALRKLFKIPTRDGRTSSWTLSVGPNVSYMISGKGIIKTDNGGRSPFTIVFHNLSDSAWIKDRSENNELDKYHFNHANRFFFGADFGIGTYIPITSRQRVLIEAKLTLGGTFIKKRDTRASLGGIIGGNGNNNPVNPIANDTGSFSDPLTTNMRTISVTVGYTFDFDVKDSKRGKSTQHKGKANKR
jgi:Outer membrane protein beta-barrel domain